MKRPLLLNVILIIGNVSIILYLFLYSGLIQERILNAKYPVRHLVSHERHASVSIRNASFGQAVPQESFRLAVAPVVSPESSLLLYNDLADYVGKRLGLSSQILLRSTYAEINELLKNRQCDVAIVCTYSFILGEREFGMRPLVIPVVGGRHTYHSFIIVPAGSTAQSLLDLKGKTFASADILSNSGWLYPVLWLKQQGEDPVHFFKEHVITGSHDRSVYSVASAYVDGAAVDHIVYEQMPVEVRNKTRVIQKSPPFGMPPLCVHPGMSKAVQSRVQSILLHMHETDEGKKILQGLGIDRFVIPESRLYDSIKEAVRVWESSS